MKRPEDFQQIITFYSYKGGTGRSMALANVAWILASAGRRVLAIDWDFEAPGLHRYFHPFIEDPELQSTPGLIDFFVDFTTAARVDRNKAASTSTSASGAVPLDETEPWYEICTNILGYACPVDWAFPNDGALDLMPAGRQDAAYPHRVTSFNWQEFYDVLGGGVFLEAFKRHLRDDYDYVLIDSRTGISDTAGICTVQMPDSLVVCFTLNRQSIVGAAAVALSVENQRRMPSGEPGIPIWPVPTRIELAEKERLDSARDLAQTTFHRYVGQLKREDRLSYWGAVEVLYQPYFAYEEVLAVFAERRGHSHSMVPSMEKLARYITGDHNLSQSPMSEEQRRRGLAAFPGGKRPRPKDGFETDVYLSYPRAQGELANRIVSKLKASGLRVWWDRDLVPGDDWKAVGEMALTWSAALVVIIDGPLRDWQRAEVEGALTRKIRVIPLLAPGLSFQDLPESLRRVTAILLDTEGFDAQLNDLTDTITGALARRSEANDAPVLPEDPQKGQWGGRDVNNGRRLSASVETITDDWFLITLMVESVDGPPLNDAVDFHLHPTFRHEKVRVQPHDSRTELKLSAWGSFTVGAVADGGRTLLELDLSLDPSFPEAFRSR